MSVTARSAAKREAILHAAADLFIEKGYDKVSVDAIVQEVGGSKANIYTYFGSKEGLFKAIVAHCCEELLEPLSRADIADLSPREALNAIGCRFLSVVLAPRTIALYRLVVSESPQFPKLGQLFYEAGPEVSFQRLAAYLSQQQAMGRLRSADPKQAATQFFGMLLCYSQMRLLLAVTSPFSEEYIAALVEDAVEVFLKGYAQ
ncbi:MAG: TetR/AcrR family transcriptional regulator [Coleofasciculaceae cyanobacterium SM2_1_6]|nr:TetR/AcrR family transcriptional regulator [Coleofasciculaceae cyanobacterium SM2_1_6]